LSIHRENSQLLKANLLHLFLEQLKSLTPDDSGALADGKIQPRARQNVILELGYFMGSLGRDRVCCLSTSNIELPSDILGITYHKFEKKVKECFWEISTELKNAGYELKL
jgi:predicted nucleotide-binding protein